MTAAHMATALRRAAERPLAVRHINASIPDPDDAAALPAALTAPDGACPPDLYAFFDEVETLSDLARSGAVGYAALAQGARRCLPPDDATRLRLDERA